MSLLILPAVLFLALFLNFFAAVDAIVSRARELRADWIAATCYGASAITTALEKVVQCSAHFSGWTDQIVLKGIALDSPRTLFQQHFAALQQDPAALQSYLDTAMNADEHEFASHPNLRTRIANLPPLAAVSDQQPTANPIAAEVTEEEAHLSAAVSVSLQQLQTLVAQRRAPQTAPSA
jgi:Zn-dependent protease with chaperone function